MVTPTHVQVHMGTGRDICAVQRQTWQGSLCSMGMNQSGTFVQSRDKLVRDVCSSGTNRLGISVSGHSPAFVQVMKNLESHGMYPSPPLSPLPPKKKSVQACKCQYVCFIPGAIELSSKDFSGLLCRSEKDSFDLLRQEFCIEIVYELTYCTLC